MAKTFQTPKGVKDVLQQEQPYWAAVEETVRRIVALYGYERLDLPVFEETALFQRGVGEGTDIVEKEMYTFQDKGDAWMTLRPEFTAGIVRAYIQHGMASLPKPVKVWTWGPVFRYERPQAGRFRQHTQFDIEALGEMDPAIDFEIMSVAWHLYEELGFENLSFQINSIGCGVCRPGYLDRLVEYYKKQSNEICEDCKNRLMKNPLRVLDCKQERCQPVIEGAPPIAESLCGECDEHFASLKGYLDERKRPYTLNHRMVRGLDYYTKTVFEVWAQGIGAQNAVCGGGRYDALAEVLGGPATPAIGFASGIERIVMTMQHQGREVTDRGELVAYFVTQGPEAKQKAVSLLTDFRKAGLTATMGYGDRSFKAQMREANRRNAMYTIILGEDEMSKESGLVKNMEDGSQEMISWINLVEFMVKKETMT